MNKNLKKMLILLLTAIIIVSFFIIINKSNNYDNIEGTDNKLVENYISENIADEYDIIDFEDDL